MLILLWLVPPIVVTLLVALWVGWRGRDAAELTREDAARRMGEALARRRPRV